MIQVIVVDDHTLIRDGLKALLELSNNSIQVIGEASNGKELIDLLANPDKTKPDLVLMDINMPEMNGLDATKHLQKHFPDIKVIILSMMEDEQFITEAFQAGASGYLIKSVGYIELTRAIEAVAEGLQYISAQITLNLLNKPSALTQKNGLSSTTKAAAEPEVSPAPDAFSEHAKPGSAIHLTKREIEVLQLIAQGYTNTQIADHLFTSKRTVENHRQSLLEKTACKNTALLIRYALNNGLIDK